MTEKSLKDVEDIIFTAEIQIRKEGKIIDLFRKNKTALCVCIHGKVWEENGIGCKECINHK